MISEVNATCKDCQLFNQCFDEATRLNQTFFPDYRFSDCSDAHKVLKNNLSLSKDVGTIKVIIGHDGSSSIDEDTATLLGVHDLWDKYVQPKERTYANYLFLDMNPVLRTDPELIKAVESKDEKFLEENRIHLRVVSIPSDVNWIVEEDGETGSEWISEVHRTWYYNPLDK